MKSCLPKVQTEVTGEGRGSGCTVCVSQPDDDPGGWLVEVWAQFTDKDSSRVFVGSVTLGTPNSVARRPTRAVVTAAMSGAFQFTALVKAPLKGATQPTKPILVGVFCGDVSPFTFTPINP